MLEVDDRERAPEALALTLPVLTGGADAEQPPLALTSVLRLGRADAVVMADHVSTAAVGETDADALGVVVRDVTGERDNAALPDVDADGVELGDARADAVTESVS